MSDVVPFEEWKPLPDSLSLTPQLPDPTFDKKAWCDSLLALAGLFQPENRGLLTVTDRGERMVQAGRRNAHVMGYADDVVLRAPCCRVDIGTTVTHRKSDLALSGDVVRARTAANLRAVCHMVEHLLETPCPHLVPGGARPVIVQHAGPEIAR